MIKIVMRNLVVTRNRPEHEQHQQPGIYKQEQNVERNYISFVLRLL